MSSKYAVDLKIPSEFPNVLKDFAREVLRAVTYGKIQGNEKDIIEYATKYFNELASSRSKTLSPEQLLDMATDLFLMADADQNGALDESEVQTVIETMASDLGLERQRDVYYVVGEVMKAAETNENGAINYKDFLPIAVQIIEAVFAKIQTDREEESLKIQSICTKFFMAYDKDGSGLLDRDEFRCVFEDISTELGMPQYASNVIDQVMKVADVNADGFVNYNEFLPIAQEVIQRVIDTAADQEQQEAERKAEDILINGMNQEQLEQALYDIFRSADADENGYLDHEEFRNALASEALGFSPEEVEELFNAVDSQMDGKVIFEDFVPVAYHVLVKLVASDIKRQNAEMEDARNQAADMLVKGMSKEELESTLFDVFRNADLDGNSYLDYEEFQKCLVETDLGFSNEEIDYMMRSCDTDGTGQIKFEQFVPLCYDLMVELIARNIQTENSENAANAENEEIARVQAEELIGGLTQEQLESTLSEMFDAADSDGNGTLDKDEFQRCLLELNIGLTDEDIPQIMDAVSLDGDRVTYGEFAPLAYDLLVEITKQELGKQGNGNDTAQERATEIAREEAEDLLVNGMTKDQVEEILVNIFQDADSDGSGTLSRDEFGQCLRDTDVGLTEGDIEYLMDKTDENQDGLISFGEFVPLAFDLLVEVMARQLVEQ